MDESRYQKIMVERLGTDHHVVRARTEMTELVPAMLHATDEPFAIASFMPLYHLSRLTREHVKVVLSGDGGDELFPIHVSLVARRELVDWVRERVANDELVDPRILAAHCLAETRLGTGED